MSKQDFLDCLELILHHEGGYVDHPDDPGGETNLGVTKKVYDAWCKEKGITPKSMRKLEVSDVQLIYKHNYWNRVNGDSMPKALALCVFDFGVNAGTGRAAKFLQKMIGTTQDGGIGPKTLAKLDEYIEKHGLKKSVNNYQKSRQKYYEKLKHFKTFGRGWTRRVTETTSSALRWV